MPMCIFYYRNYEQDADKLSISHLNSLWLIKNEVIYIADNVT